MSSQITHIGKIARGYIPPIIDPIDGITPLSADSITYTIRLNGVDTSGTVNITELLTGLNEWSYNHESVVEGDQISIL